MKKPRIGADVYTIYGWSIEHQKVYAIGKESFISDNFCKATTKETQEWEFCHYGITWFYSMKKAQVYLKEKFKLRWPRSHPYFIGDNEYSEAVANDWGY